MKMRANKLLYSYFMKNIHKNINSSKFSDKINKTILQVDETNESKNENEKIKIVKLNYSDGLKQFSKKFTEEEMKKYLDPYGFVNSTDKIHVNTAIKENENLKAILKSKENKDSSNNINKENDKVKIVNKKEYGMKPSGLEPTRYGDWERNGKCVDF